MSQNPIRINEAQHGKRTIHVKLIVAFVEDSKTDEIMEAARDAGATGCMVIKNARGEGIKESKTFFGLTLATQVAHVLN